MKTFDSLTEQEILALAISLEEEDARVYEDFAAGLQDNYPEQAEKFRTMRREEDGHRHRLLELYKGKFGDHVPLIRRQDVRGFVDRKPVWLTRPLGLKTVHNCTCTSEKNEAINARETGIGIDRSTARREFSAISELFSRHYSSCLRLARGILCLKTTRRTRYSRPTSLPISTSASFAESRRLRTWLSRIVINRCMVQRRTPGDGAAWIYLDELPGGREPTLLRVTRPPRRSPRNLGEINSALASAVARLPGNLRDAFTLYCISGLSVKEIAATLGLTPAAAKTRVFRARAKVRSHLQPVWSHRHAA